jgi:ribonuclease Z
MRGNLAQCENQGRNPMSPTTVTFLGTGTVTPEAGHDTASFLINRKILVDTGWYSAVRMLSFGASPLDLEYLILTHCHHDHYIGLPQLLFYRRMRHRDRPDLPPLNIVGPADDVQRIVDLSRGLLQTDRFPDTGHIPVVHPVAPGGTFETDSFKLETCETIHAVQGICCRFADKATGAVFGFTGDTAFHPPIAEHLSGCELIVHEASYAAAERENAKAGGHSSARDAARIADAARARRLALVHLPPGKAEGALAAAKGIFPGAFWPADGEEVLV